LSVGLQGRCQRHSLCSLTTSYRLLKRFNSLHRVRSRPIVVFSPTILLSIRHIKPLWGLTVRLGWLRSDLSEGSFLLSYELIPKSGCAFACDVHILNRLTSLLSKSRRSIFRLSPLDSTSLPPDPSLHITLLALRGAQSRAFCIVQPNLYSISKMVLGHSLAIRSQIQADI